MRRKTSKQDKCRKRKSYKKRKLSKRSYKNKKGGNAITVPTQGITPNSNYGPGQHKAIWRAVKNQNKTTETSYIETSVDLNNKNSLLLVSNEPINERELSIHKKLADNRLAPKIGEKPVEFTHGKNNKTHYLYVVQKKKHIKSINLTNDEKCDEFIKTLSNLIDTLFDKDYINLDMKISNLVFDFDEKNGFKAYAIDTDPLYFINIALLKEIDKLKPTGSYDQRNKDIRDILKKDNRFQWPEVLKEEKTKLKDLNITSNAYKSTSKKIESLHLTIPDIHGEINYLSNIFTYYNEFISTLNEEEKEEGLKIYNKFVGLYMLIYGLGGLSKNVNTDINRYCSDNIKQYMTTFHTDNDIKINALINYLNLINWYKIIIFQNTTYQTQVNTDINYLIWYYCFRPPHVVKGNSKDYEVEVIAQKMIDTFSGSQS